MAAADDDRDREILRLRDRMHRAENLLTAHGLDHETLKNHEERLRALEKMANKALGVMIVGGVVVPPATALLIRWVG